MKVVIQDITAERYIVTVESVLVLKESVLQGLYGHQRSVTAVTLAVYVQLIARTIFYLNILEDVKTWEVSSKALCYMWSTSAKP